MENDLIRRSDVIETIENQCSYGNMWGNENLTLIDAYKTIDELSDIPAVDAVEVPETGIGDLSDGFHTFNGLYYQRLILFAALVKAHKDKAWKSWRHEDGELPFGKENYFIVGLDTPEGAYTYHYHGEYWDLFDCQELPRGKHWDGHTEADVTRLLSLATDTVVHSYWEHREEPEDIYSWVPWYCHHCGMRGDKHQTDYCPHCGARMDGTAEDSSVVGEDGDT